MSVRGFDITKNYNREEMLDFLRDFLPDDFEQIEEQTFFEFTNIEEGYKLGFSNSLNLDVYEFRTKSNRDPRVTLTKEVVSCIKNYGYNPNALAIFYSLESNSWRFSLITTDYSFEDGKLKRTYSNPRRFSFKLGKDCKRHTPEQMLFSKGQIRERTENGKTLTVIEDLKSRFAIEVVSNEFFNEYKVFYEDFVQYITGNRFVKTSGNKYEKKPISEQNKEIFNQFEQIANGDYELACKYVRDYIKKLMGRLVFLHFLQKKGWLGVNEESLWGDGNKSYLLNLFKNSSSTEQENFLDKVLEPLFFGMLNTPEAERKALFEEKKWNPQLLSTFNRIPYLNGGLFESDKLDELKVIFPKELFSNEKSPDKERKYQGAIQDYPFTECCGLLDFFERYNFTIDETDPSDMEIGVDPEMLGKIFENLLEDNKDKGAFYTPKEIVQYMCRESLIAYLLTDSKIEEEKIRNFVIQHIDNFIESEKSELIQKLKSVKICDPAVGSGAFPMGMLNELYACRHVIEEDTSPVDIKKEIVKENIYGVDIEKGAVDIARLRFWLAIIVDETEPIPLPNLDYKIMQGNSLLECYEGIDLSHMLEKPANGEFDYTEEQRNLITTKMKDYFNENNHNEKQVKNDIIKELVCELVYTTCGIKPNDDKAFALREKIYNGTSDFFLWHTWFNDVFNRPNDCNGGFDIVIGNPPYISAPMQIANQGLAEQRQKLVDSKNYKSLYQKWDLYIPFIELGTKLNSENGITTMIVPFPLTNQLYAKSLRKILVEENNMYELVDLNGTKIFDNATVSNCIPFVRKGDRTQKTWISNIFENKEIQRVFEQNISDLIQDEKSLVWNVTQKKRKANRHSGMHVLGDFCYISVGMVLNANEKTAKGEFKKEDLISLTQDEIHCRKYIEAKDIEKYRVNRIRYLEYNTNRVPNQLRRPTFRELYTIPKLMFNRLGELQVFFDENGAFTTSDAMFVCLKWDSLSKVENKSIASSIKKFSNLTREEMEKLSESVDLRYLLGIMNSRYASVLLTNLRGGDYHIYPEHIRNIPIPSVSKEQQQLIINLVDQILVTKKDNYQADTSVLEHQIDLLVYHLYALTFEEAKIIDENLTEEEFNTTLI